MSAELIQIVPRSGSIRGPVGSYTPPDLIEIFLEPNERVIQIEWSRGYDAPTRKTVDWKWTAWIESRHPLAEEPPDPKPPSLGLTDDDLNWIEQLLNAQIRELRGSGRGSWGAQWTRDLRALREKILQQKA